MSGKGALSFLMVQVKTRGTAILIQKKVPIKVVKTHKYQEGRFVMVEGIYRTNHILIGLSKEKTILGDHPKAHIDEIRHISCEIKRHSLPTALHKTDKFLLSYLIYKVFRWISWNLPQISRNPPDFERPIARNGNAYLFLLMYMLWIWIDQKSLKICF